MYNFVIDGSDIMKRLIGILVTLFLLYMLIQLGFKYLGHGHTVNYTIKNKNYTIKIKEEATFRQKTDADHYDFTITINNQEFPLQTYQNLKKEDHVIKEIKYVKTKNYECIYPILKNGLQITDIMCKKENTIYHYHNLKETTKEIDEFAHTLKKEGYQEKNWEENITDSQKEESGSLVVYKDNIVKNHYLGVDHYSGIYLINNYLKERVLYNIQIFQNDTYEKVIDGSGGQYYLVADYNSKHDFQTFYIVDLVYNDQKTIKYHSPISFNSYIQGTIDKNVYLFDRDSKKQYKINPNKKTIVEIGNEQTGIQYYKEGKWEEKKAVEAITSDLTFHEYQVETDKEYEQTHKVGNQYYYYKKVGNNYEVYRSNLKNKEIKTYLFKTTKIDEIKYIHDYVYFKEGMNIKYYHDTTGIKTVLSNREFEFNKTLHYYLYYSKK